MQLTQLARKLEQSTPETLRIKAAQLIEELLRISSQTLTSLDEHLKLDRSNSSSRTQS